MIIIRHCGILFTPLGRLSAVRCTDDWLSLQLVRCTPHTLRHENSASIANTNLLYYSTCCMPKKFTTNRAERSLSISCSSRFKRHSWWNVCQIYGGDNDDYFCCRISTVTTLLCSRYVLTPVCTRSAFAAWCCSTVCMIRRAASMAIVNPRPTDVANCGSAQLCRLTVIHPASLSAHRQYVRKIQHPKTVLSTELWLGLMQ